MSEDARVLFLMGLVVCSTIAIYTRYVFVKSHDIKTKTFYTRFGIKDETELAKQKVQVRGKIISELEIKTGYQRMVVEIMSGTFQTKNPDENFKDLYILVKNKSQEWQHFEYADYVTFTTKLSKPKNIEGEDGRIFDYESYLSKDDIFFVGDTFDMKLDEWESEQVVGKRSKNFNEKVIISLYRFKQEFMKNVERSLPLPHAYLANGLVISGKGSLSKIIQDQFQKVGLIHIVVLSGFNISIIGETIIKVLSFLPKILSGILGSIGIVLFGIMAGGGATVYRSVIMALIGVYARIFDRKNSAVVSLFVAGVLMLLVNPKLLTEDPGFQLSFMATFGLIALSSPIEKVLMSFWKKVSPWFNFGVEPNAFIKSIVELTSSTLATQVTTFPLIIQFSGLISFIALPVNLLVLPFIPLTMLTVFFVGVLGFIIPWFDFIPATVSWLLLSYEFAVVKLGSSIPYGFIKLGPVSKQWITSLYIIVLALITLGNFDISEKFFKNIYRLTCKLIFYKRSCVT